MAEFNRADALRVEEASLAPLPWMGPVGAQAEMARRTDEEKGQLWRHYRTTAS